MTNKQQTNSTPGPYGYRRDRDGCHDIFFIEDTRDGTIIMGIYFWDEPDTGEAAQAEAKAQLIVQALNMPGCWIDQYHVTRSTLRTHQQIAAIWSVEDVLEIRSDLTENQAWEVLQQVDGYHDADHGVTWDTLRWTARELFPSK